MQPAYHALTYHRDALLRWFAPLANQPWAMLLHSGDAEHPDSRFDILVADPVATLVTRGEHTVITTAAGKSEHADDPLTLVQEMMAGYLPEVSVDEALPFQGGALGLFGYDLGRRFESVMPQQAISDLDDTGYGGRHL